MTFAQVGNRPNRCPMCGTSGSQSCCPCSSNSCSSPAYPRSGDSVLSAQTEKILQLRREAGQPNNGISGRVCDNYPIYSSSNGSRSKLANDQPSCLRKPNQNPPYKLERCMPYDLIHADLVACSVKPKPGHRSSSVQSVRGGCGGGSSGRINQAISHIDSARAILSHV
ncbi:hypothetical protein TRFO_39953 [Tritrichomonas foetus]|uniref:Uncharacterized protein n=1 Tax=Tritrichomonas foetus TaxID=1144522 RepID=A0A1J4J921_9EUKA|nr:hypothetical protein [Tritrichomonas foetus]OHS93909.1 hypothetical protein TRFO_39953 [Tritrichomonas foetus]|eukprot:OHS93909.1 hypothetical protein TRFO_39953 [Tritrichomonas foetus]